jgi:predicted nicotinamide N-methyase
MPICFPHLVPCHGFLSSTHHTYEHACGFSDQGAGQGIVSFSAAALGAERVIVTDVESAMPSLQQGVTLNGFSTPQVQVVTLDWTDRAQAIEHIWNDLLAVPPSPTSETTRKESDRSSEDRSSASRLDYILASDVIWVDYLIPALVDTMKDLIGVDHERAKQPEERLVEQQLQQSVLDDPSANLSRTSPPVVLLAYQFRSTRSDRLLFDALDQLGLKRRKLSLTGVDKDDRGAVELDPKFQKSNLAIWKIWRE